MRPTYRPHYLFCPSVCSSVLYGFLSQKQKGGIRKPEWTLNTSDGMSITGVPIFSLEDQTPNVKRTQRKWRTFRVIPSSVKLNLPSTPETLSNRTGGRISCRHSVPPTSSLVILCRRLVKCIDIRGTSSSKLHTGVHHCFHVDIWFAVRPSPIISVIIINQSELP